MMALYRVHGFMTITIHRELDIEVTADSEAAAIAAAREFDEDGNAYWRDESQEPSEPHWSAELVEGEAGHVAP